MDKDIEQIGGTFNLELKDPDEKGITGSSNLFIYRLEQCRKKLQSFMDTELNFANYLYGPNEELARGGSKIKEQELKDKDHESHIFDIDTAHDGINPKNRAEANLENKLVSYKNYVTQIEKNSIIIPRTDLINIDNSYSIIKDAGPGSVLFSLSNLIDSAGTPDFNKYKAVKGNDYDLNADGKCIQELKNILKDKDLTKLPRIFTLDQNACADTDSSISRSDLKLYEYLQNEKKLIDFDLLNIDADGQNFSEFTDEGKIYGTYQNDETTKNNPEFKNLYLMNFIWQINLYYCIKLCIKPNPNKKYSKGLGFLNRIVFSEFEKNKTSITPIFSMNGSNLQDSSNRFRTKILELISDVFLNLFREEGYITQDDYERYIYQEKSKMQGSHAFLISQSAIAKGIKSLLSKHTDFRNESQFKADNIQSRSDEGTVLNADFTVTSLTSIYFGFWKFNNFNIGRPQYQANNYLYNAIFMLRMLKFMGDRSHIVISKLIHKSQGNDNLRDHILLTLDRPLQVSVVKENLNGLFKLQAQHDLIFNEQKNEKNQDKSIYKPFSTYKSSRLLLYAPNISFNNLVEIISTNFVYTLLWDYLAYEGENISVLNSVFFIYIVKGEEDNKICDYKATIKIRNGKYSTKINFENTNTPQFFREFAFAPKDAYTWEYWDSAGHNWSDVYSGNMSGNIGCGFYSKFEGENPINRTVTEPPYYIYITGKEYSTSTVANNDNNTNIAEDIDISPPRDMTDVVNEIIGEEVAVQVPSLVEEVVRKATDADISSVPIQKLAKKFKRKDILKEGDILRITKTYADNTSETIIGTVEKDYLNNYNLKIDHIDYYGNLAGYDSNDPIYKNAIPPLKKTQKRILLSKFNTPSMPIKNVQMLSTPNKNVMSASFEYASLSDVITNYTNNLTKWLEIDSKEFYSTFNNEYIPILTKLNSVDKSIIDIRQDLNYLLGANKDENNTNNPYSRFKNVDNVEEITEEITEQISTNNPFIGFYYRVCQKNDFSAPKTHKYLKVVLAILDRLQLLKKYSGQEDDIKDNHSMLILKQRAYYEYNKLKLILAQNKTLIQLNNSLNTKFVKDDKDDKDDEDKVEYGNLDYVLTEDVNETKDYIIFDVQNLVKKYFMRGGAVPMYAKHCWQNYKVLKNQCQNMRRANKQGELKVTKKHKEREDTLMYLREIRNRLIESKLFSINENNEDQKELTRKMRLECYPPWLKNNLLEVFIQNLADRADELDQFFDMTYRPTDDNTDDRSNSQSGGNPSDNNFSEHFFDLISLFF